MRRLVTRADVIIITAVILLAAFLWVLNPKETGETAVIRVDGKEYITVNINGELTETTVNGVSIVYGGGDIYIKDSTCRDKICVKAGRLSKQGQSAVCAPNRVSVEIKGKSKNAPWAVTG